MELPCEVVFNHPRQQRELDILRKSTGIDRIFFEQLERAFKHIRQNAFIGIRIPKRLIPLQYNTNNLWKYNLSKGWRLLHSLENNNGQLTALIIEWLDHTEYERRFNY